jgi:hypothetical protein
MAAEASAERFAAALFVQTLLAYIAFASQSYKPRSRRAIIDPMIDAAPQAIQDNGGGPWTVESPAATAGMSRSAWAAGKVVRGQSLVCGVQQGDQTEYSKHSKHDSWRVPIERDRDG